METLVSLKNISLEYQKKRALYDINLDILPNEFLTLIGPNGAGKTSLLKLIIGLIKPTGGSIYKKPNLNISYLPQKFDWNPFIPITVIDFIQLSQKSTKAEISDTLENVGIENCGNRFVKSLSGGEFQRVMIAKALLAKPDLIILDEPGQNVDFSGQLIIYKLIEDLFKRIGCSIIMVSHDIHMVMSQTNTVICLYGHICCKGKPESVSNEQSFIKYFGKVSLELLATYKHNHSHTHDSETVLYDTENNLTGSK